MLHKKPSKLQFITSALISVVVISAAAWAVLNRQYVADQITVWSHTPSESIQAIDDRVSFTDKGSFYFYATQPELASGEAFNGACPREEVGSPILGCYANGRIYIFDITNQQLDGLEEVTAAHEMLHAVWERMGEDEKLRISGLLDAEYAELANDSDLKERMDYYARTEPGEFYNELHSIVGTEQADLGQELEKYYGRFFSDRSKVLALHDTYDSVFQGLKDQSTALFDELTVLGSQLEARSAQYEVDARQLSADIASFNSRADSSEFTSMAQFNQERNALVARSNQLEAERQSINDGIALYNEKYQQYEALALQIESLNKSLDSLGDLQAAPVLN